jgi:SP family general alpha glucoside:H+ symporter-like MFS transporter
MVLVWVFVYDFTVGVSLSTSFSMTGADGQPVAYTIVGESSSTRLRSKTVGLGRISYNISRIVAGFLCRSDPLWLTARLTLRLVPGQPLRLELEGKSRVLLGQYNVCGESGTLIVQGGTAFLAFVWAYFRLPEFKDRSFRELDILFSRGISARRFKETEVVEDDDA